MFLLKLFCAVIPAVILMWFLYGRGKGVSLTPKRIKWPFVWGMMVIIPIFLIFGPCDPERGNSGIFEILYSTALPEELLKMVTMLVLLKRYQCASKIDTLVVCGSVGLGFACLENILFVITRDNWIGVAIARAISSVPNHFSYAIIMGYFIYRAFNIVKTKKQKLLNLSNAFILPTLLHWTKNAFIELSYNFFGIFVVFIMPALLLVIAFKIIKKARQEAIEGQ